MVVNAIKVYARIKKEVKPNEKWLYTSKRNGEYEDIIFHNSLRVEHGGAQKFRFHQIFDENQRQNEIFDAVAKPVVISVLQGFNGTIFAYGQTGSGKTYSMTGSTKQYEDRGIIPRSLQYIFEALEKIEEKPTLYISYMEIYNEICYDLLSPRDNKTAVRLEELPRVTLLENKKGEPCLRNLSVLPVATEEEAMRLLFLGDTNRAIAETPLNEYSSRSHCIFTVYVSSRLGGSKGMTFSKLNLVDLAGSERVHKSNISGTILNEAKHINLSLHFLQQVILALSESKRTHIPYRNSLMTLILKDSLVGNSLTVMLATLAVSRRNIQETISTCRFAQRVSLIKTDPVINEVSDPYQEILLLKNEVQELRKQLANREQGFLIQDSKCLTSKQKEDLEAKLEIYLNSDEDLPSFDLAPGLLQNCFRFFKGKIKMLENKIKEKEILFSAPTKAKNHNKGSPRNYLHGEYEDNSKETNLQHVWNDTPNPPEVDYYLKRLSITYEKAKLLSAAIEECQANISYIREKLEFMSKAGDCRRKLALCNELEHQQKIYKDSLMQLKDLKNETLQLEAGLTKAKAKTDHLLTEQTPYHTQSPHPKLLSEPQEETRRKDTCLRCLEEKQFSNSESSFNLDHREPHLQIRTSDCCWDCLSGERNAYGDVHRHTYKGYCQQSTLRRPNQFEDIHKCYCYPKYCKVVDFPDISSNLVANHCASDRSICCQGYFKCGSTKCIRREIEEDKGKFIDNGHVRVIRTVTSDHSGANNAYCPENKGEKCACNQYTSIPATKIVDGPPKLIEDKLRNNGNKTGGDLSIVETANPNLMLDCEVQLIPDKLSKPEFQCATISNRPSPSCQQLVIYSDMSDNNISSCSIDLNRPTECTTLEQSDNKYDLFQATDTEEFKKFVSTLTLTGDEEVDREICDFYRAKLCP